MQLIRQPDGRVHAVDRIEYQSLRYNGEGTAYISHCGRVASPDPQEGTEADVTCIVCRRSIGMPDAVQKWRQTG